MREGKDEEISRKGEGERERSVWSPLWDYETAKAGDSVVGRGEEEWSYSRVERGCWEGKREGGDRGGLVFGGWDGMPISYAYEFESSILILGVSVNTTFREQLVPVSLGILGTLDRAYPEIGTSPSVEKLGFRIPYTKHTPLLCDLSNTTTLSNFDLNFKFCNFPARKQSVFFAPLI